MYFSIATQIAQLKLFKWVRQLGQSGRNKEIQSDYRDTP